MGDEDIETCDATHLRRRIGYVLQQPALFPHWTVARNTGVVLRLLKWPREKQEKRVKEILERVKLPYAAFAHRYPAQLSGGQQQRVGIARALAADPPLILYDEPFSALDPITRSELQLEVVRLKESLRKTAIFVTHDIREAFLLGDKILIMEHGKAIQFGTPDEIRQTPANPYVEHLISIPDEA